MPAVRQKVGADEVDEMLTSKADAQA